MADISAKLVMELRERTGAGMMECKKALTAVGGDIEKAVDEMRKLGQARADKKASRVAAEGLIVIKVSDDKKKAVLAEINCETDFVARDSNFVAFANQVAEHLLKGGSMDDAKLDEARKELITKLGENINIRRAETFTTSSGHLGTYVHSGRIGVVVELEGGDVELARDLAMHVAAVNPLVVSGNDVPAEVVAREREIFIGQAKESGKPMDIIEKMIDGRMRKFMEEVSLTGQMFVKDPTVRVVDLLKNKSATVKGFKRLLVGEGIEKEKVDFVKEVMAQVNK